MEQEYRPTSIARLPFEEYQHFFRHQAEELGPKY